MFRNYGILGQNARNLHYIKSDNFSIARRLADSKLKTKKFLAANGVSVPATLDILRSYKEISEEKIDSYELPFVIKPNNGYGGKGILIIDQKDAAGNYITNTGEVYTPKQITEHLTYVLDGFFSLSGGRDRVLIEKKIVLTKEIDLLGTFGLPDIRVVAYNMIPVMAMMRIPTKESDGKANIHAGACAAGIDLGSGKITYISKNGVSIKSVPGLGDIRGITIPAWDEILALAVKVQMVSGIKFLGCDVVLDEKDGPLLLEINIRPGLEIQNVNLAPLMDRLHRVEGLDVSSVEKGVRLGRDLFSGEIEEKIKSISGKEVLGQREYISIFDEEKRHTFMAEIRISNDESSILREFAQEALHLPVEGKKTIRLDIELGGIKKLVKFTLRDEGDNIYLGRSALKGFLVDPFKYKKGENPYMSHEELNGDSVNTAITKIHASQLQELDKQIFDIDKKLIILKYITPKNIAEEKQKFIESQGKYTPSFEYEELPFDPQLLLEQLEAIDIAEIPLHELYLRKKEEVRNKLQFFIAFSEQNIALMAEQMTKIFGEVKNEYFVKSKERIALRDMATREEEFASEQDINALLKKFNHIYNIKVKLKVGEYAARFTMKGDTLMMREGAKVGKREIRSIIAHEIEGHYLRKCNGKNSQLQIMTRGGARYIEIDEGIAIYNQNRFLSPADSKYYSVFERYYFVQFALKHSYRKLVLHLCEMYDNDYERVFNYMLRLKRGVQDPAKNYVCMKDVVYVNGFFEVENYIDTGGSLKDLYIGKLHLRDIEQLRQSEYYKKWNKDLLIPFFV